MPLEAKEALVTGVVCPYYVQGVGRPLLSKGQWPLAHGTQKG